MKEINIRLIFPYNWYHARRIGVYDDKGRLLTKIGHFEERKVVAEPGIEYIVLKIDFYRFKIQVPRQSDDLNLIIYMKFRDRFPLMYIDSLKKNLIQGEFVDAATYKAFDHSFYKTSKEWIGRSKVDMTSVILGVLISAGLIVMSVIEQENHFQELIFFIGIASLISLLMIWLEKGKLLLYDYKSRMLASGAAFMLGTFLLQDSFPVATAFLIFSLAFILKVYSYLKGNIGLKA